MEEKILLNEAILRDKELKKKLVSVIENCIRELVNIDCSKNFHDLSHDLIKYMHTFKEVHSIMSRIGPNYNQMEDLKEQIK